MDPKSIVDQISLVLIEVPNSDQALADIKNIVTRYYKELTDNDTL